MNLRRIFARTRPTPPAPALHPNEAAIIAWYDLTPDEWAALPNHLRAEYRGLYMKARMP